MSEHQHVELVADRTVDRLVRVALFAALLGVLSYVAFPYPLSPAPVTLQVLGVFLAGIFLGPIWGAIAVVVYLVAGAIGLPVFSMGQSGIGVLLSERVGFLVSFPIAAAMTGAIVHGGRSLVDPTTVSTLRLVLGMTLATGVIYLLGLIGFMIVLSMGPVEAFVVAGLVFLPAEVAKMAGAIAIVRSARLPRSLIDR